MGTIGTQVKTDALVARAIALRNSGMTLATIADYLGVSRQYVHQLLRSKEMGIPAARLYRPLKGTLLERQQAMKERMKEQMRERIERMRRRGEYGKG
jgi:excisionase family DNA binding protein